MKTYHIKKLDITGGLSYLRGGWQNGTKYVFEMSVANNGDKLFVIDSTQSNIDKSSPWHYYGTDVQLKLHHGWGETELRAEYWFGSQPGTSTTTANPGTIPNVNGIPLPTYVRHFDGAFFLFLQSIINSKNQLLVKYDWYDPNIKVKNTEIGKNGTNLTAADIKFATLGLGYIFHFNYQTKIILYYDIVKNELTNFANTAADQKDNILTCRLQFRF